MFSSAMKTRSLCLAPLALAALAAAQDSPPPLVGVKIPLSFDALQRYVADVDMATGSNTQHLKFALVGNTGYNGVVGTTCSNCDNVPAYNQSASTTAQSIPGSRSLNIGSGEASGSLIREDCALRKSDGSSWAYPNQTIVLVNSSNSLFSGSTSGFLGLGTNANGANGDFADTIYGGWLQRNPPRNNFSFGMALRNQDDPAGDLSADGSAGELDWVVPDSSSYNGDIVTRQALVSSDAPGSSVSPNAPGGQVALALPESDWAVQLDQWSASYNDAAVANGSDAQVAIIEPWLPDIIFPRSQAELYYNLVPEARLQNNLVNGTSVWSVPCDFAPSLGFSFEQQNFVLEQNKLVIQQADGSCVGAVKAWSDPGTTTFLLGARFISSFYLIFTVGRPGSGIPNTIGFARRPSSKSSTNVGAIVGGVVGGVIFLVIVAAGIYVFMRRRRLRKQATLAPTPAYIRDSGSDTEKKGGNGTSVDVNDGAQYASYGRPVSGISSNHTGTAYGTPPHSARSAESHHPLLPEPQSPQSPYLDIPGSAGARYASNQIGMGMPIAGVFPSPQLSQAGSGSTASGPAVYTGSDGQNYVIDPYTYATTAVGGGAGAAGQRESKGSPVHSQRPVSGTYGTPGGVAHSVNPPSTSHDGSESGEPTVEPFVLPPAPRRQADRKGSPVMQRVDEETPAPPYRENDHAAEPGTSTGTGTLVVSPTLVEYNPSTDANRDSRQTG